ncbi:MAG: endonuclease Q family protein [Deltaproteobacteria bacterium]|nr:endonuclease Q family protein [Deltaproteobacteria bacterium]
MRTIADLHVHTKYSRATSRDMTLPVMAKWAQKKGIDILGTGDFTHPAHFKAIEKELASIGGGLFTLKTEAKEKTATRFVLSAEISSIYKQGDKTRKIHSLVFMPDIEAVRKFNSELARRGNIASDGRPILGVSAKELLKLALDASKDAVLIPAHAWTPWFSVFGSKSGFDSIEECFEELTPHVFAIETGLSSNPAMNRRISRLDTIALISNSDAHSPSKLGREANVLAGEPDYFEMMRAIKARDPKKFLFTIEFFPEEGKYHHDGHRSCGVSLTPAETKKRGSMCPVCGKELTIGVSSRVEELSDRPEDASEKGFIPSKAVIPLEEIIAEAFDKGVNTKGVKAEYERIIEKATEFEVLLDMPDEEIRKIANERVAEGVIKVRQGEVSIVPGFDGEFGKIKIFSKAEPPSPKGPSQMGLV